MNDMEFYIIRQDNGSLWLCTVKPYINEYSGNWTVGNTGSMVRLPGYLFKEVRIADKEPNKIEINLIINKANTR